VPVFWALSVSNIAKSRHDVVAVRRRLCYHWHQKQYSQHSRRCWWIMPNCQSVAQSLMKFNTVCNMAELAALRPWTPSTSMSTVPVWWCNSVNSFFVFFCCYFMYNNVFFSFSFSVFLFLLVCQFLFIFLVASFDGLRPLLVTSHCSLRSLATKLRSFVRSY